MSLVQERGIENHCQVTSFPPSNALSHLNLVDNLIRKADKQVDQQRRLIQLLRQQLQQMKTKVQGFQQQIINTLKPSITSCCQQLGVIQLQQKEDNTSFQTQITQLKKQKMLISQMITTSTQHTQDLIQQIGGY